jgi:hypothetical protein
MINNYHVVISKVSNGWVVNLPIPHNPFGGLPSTKEIRRQAKIMKQEILGDNMLDNVGEDTDEEKTTIQKIEDVHIFKTFPEVLAFLKFTIEEDSAK